MRGLGTDLVDIARVAALLAGHGERFRNRVFTPDELAAAASRGEDGEAAALAARWAAKEAFVKALGPDAAAVPLRAVEVADGGAGRPVLRLHGAAAAALAGRGAATALLSLARAGGRAIAIVAID